MGTLFAADRGLVPKAGTNRRGRVGITAGSNVSPQTAKTNTVAVGGRNGDSDRGPPSVIPPRLIPVHDESSRGPGPIDSLGDNIHPKVSNTALPVEANVPVLPQVVQEIRPLVKEIDTPIVNTPSVLPPDLQVSLF